MIPRFKSIAKRLMQFAGAAVTLGVICVAFLFGWLRRNHSRETALPLPTGSFAVGRTELVWRDQARDDPFAASPGSKRELVVWLWYPATTSSAVHTADYVPAAERKVRENNAGVILSQFVDLDRSRMRAHSLSDAEVSRAKPTHPVVFLKSGIGAFATDYTICAENLASHGYIVVGNDSPYTTSVVVFPDGRVATRTSAGHPDPGPLGGVDPQLNRLIEVWSADTRFMLDQLERLNTADPTGRFTGRLDLGSVGIVGHSFGGATAAQFCHDEPRCKAGIDIDGMPFGSVIKEGLRQPFMFLDSDHGAAADPESRQIMADIQSIHAQAGAGSLWLGVRGSRHFNFSDQALIKPRQLSRIAGALGPVDERRALVVANAYICAFFDAHLNHVPSALLGGPSQDFPEIEFIRR